MTNVEKARMMEEMSRQTFGWVDHEAEFTVGARRPVGVTILVAVTVATASLVSLLSLAAYA